MSINLSWRRVVLGLGLLAGVATALGLRTMPGADAQEPPPSATFVFSDVPITASNGFASLNAAFGIGTGYNDGILGIACTGANPVGGTARIPAMVVTDVGDTDTRLRIVQANGVTVTGAVQINCVIEVILTAEGTATAEGLREAANAG